MAQQNSFDIVSEVDSAEIANALNQTLKEVRQRFDFKGSSAQCGAREKRTGVERRDETKLRNMNDILQQKLKETRRPAESIQLRQDRTCRCGGTVRQRAQIQEGIPTEKAKEVVKFIKDSKAKPGFHSGRHRGKRPARSRHASGHHC